MSPAKLEARMESLFSFPVGLFHPLQHVGFARRSPVCPCPRSSPTHRLRKDPRRLISELLGTSKE